MRSGSTSAWLGLLATGRKSNWVMNVARTAAAGLAVAARDRRPVEGVERVVVVDPVVAAEHDAADGQLHQVVEHAPRTIDLPLAVAADVVGEPGARRDLVAEIEVHAGIVLAVGGHVLALRPHAEVQRQPAVERPRVLHEQADVVRFDVADRHEADDVVVAVRPAQAAAVVEGVGLVPEQLHRRRLLARQRVVDDAFELEAALDRVLAAPVGVARDVGVEVEAAQPALHEARARRVVGEPVGLLQARGDLGELEVRGLERVPQGIAESADVVLVGLEACRRHVDVGAVVDDPVEDAGVGIVGAVAADDRGKERRVRRADAVRARVRQRVAALVALVRGGEPAAQVAGDLAGDVVVQDLSRPASG